MRKLISMFNCVIHSFYLTFCASSFYLTFCLSCTSVPSVSTISRLFHLFLPLRIFWPCVCVMSARNTNTHVTWSLASHCIQHMVHAVVVVVDLILVHTSFDTRMLLSTSFSSMMMRKSMILIYDEKADGGGSRQLIHQWKVLSCGLNSPSATLLLFLVNIAAPVDSTLKRYSMLL